MTYQENRPRLLAIGWHDDEMDLFAQLLQMGFAISPVTSKQAALTTLLADSSYSGLMINADTDMFDAYLLCKIMRTTFKMPIVMVAANGQRLCGGKAADAAPTTGRCCRFLPANSPHGCWPRCVAIKVCRISRRRR
ncbi:MAG: hypothetical protein R2856_13680 [Caldilineaceae bacterium]